MFRSYFLLPKFRCPIGPGQEMTWVQRHFWSSFPRARFRNSMTFDDLSSWIANLEVLCCVLLCRKTAPIRQNSLSQYCICVFSLRHTPHHASVRTVYLCAFSFWPKNLCSVANIEPATPLFPLSTDALSTLQPHRIVVVVVASQTLRYTQSIGCF